MKEISTDEAPEAIGPYSQAMHHGDTVYVSGQGPANPESREIEVESVSEQAKQVLENVSAILDAVDASLDDVVKATVYLRDIDDYDDVNEVYTEYMTEPFPARAAVEVAALPLKKMDVEIEVIAAV